MPSLLHNLPGHHILRQFGDTELSVAVLVQIVFVAPLAQIVLAAPVAVATVHPIAFV